MEVIHTYANILLLLLIFINGCAVAMTRNLLTATILFCTFSLLMSLLYVVLKAPDVAITEAAIGAGISTILFLAALLLTGVEEKHRPFNKIIIPAFIFLGVGLILAVVYLPNMGSATSPTNTHVAPYYIEHTKDEIHVKNIVTAVLASYRGFDTMGETFVIFTGGISIYALLFGALSKRPGRNSGTKISAKADVKMVGKEKTPKITKNPIKSASSTKSSPKKSPKKTAKKTPTNSQPKAIS